MRAALTPRQIGPFLPDINTTDKQNASSARLSRTRHRTGKVKVRDTEQKETAAVTTDQTSQSQTVSKHDITLFRNSLKHNTCVEMLRQGFHRSFSELFSLLQCWRESRLAAGPGSAIWLQTPPEEQPDKLKTLQYHLTQAEYAQRTGAWSTVYDHQLSLAQFFTAPEDRWLRYRFYQLCLLSARKVDVDGGPKEAEASANMADVYIEQGLLYEAREQSERFYLLTEAVSWVDSSGRSLRFLACERLWRVHSELADRLMAVTDYSLAIQHLNKAYDMATEAGEKRIVGESAYRLGQAYQCVGDQLSAIKFLTMYMEITSMLQDADGLGKAYKAISKSMESEGSLGETVQYLERFADVSHRSNLQNNMEDASMCLGNSYYRTGQYQRGCEYFQRGFDIACHLEDVPLLQKAQVLVGSARAHSLIRKYSAAVESATPTALSQLLAWKERREDQPFISAEGRTGDEQEEDPE